MPKWAPGMYGIVTLYDAAFQPTYPGDAAGNAPLDYNSDGTGCQNDFQVELLPLHSQLLGESLLVSFPPLINMLKSSGSSYLISGPIGEVKGGGGRACTARLGTADSSSERRLTRTERRQSECRGCPRKGNTRHRLLRLSCLGVFVNQGFPPVWPPHQAP